MKKILLIIFISFFIIPLFVFATDYSLTCADVGGTKGTFGWCYCSDNKTINPSAGIKCNGDPVGGTGTGTDTGGTGTNTGGTGSNTGGTGTNTGGTGSSTGGITNPISAETFGDLISMVVKWILDMAMVLAPLVIVYGGLTYMTAAGDTSKVNQAKQIILYAAIGLILALLAWSLIDILKGLVVK
ncbi:MAG TPA: pilin [Candidatus Pacearchaeota archaeon]|nr:pilin [Candidatus Pacearchaeota archaeon]HPR79714.1 pilin [Candidatus Pacearchaeota archaeon]